MSPWQIGGILLLIILAYLLIGLIVSIPSIRLEQKDRLKTYQKDLAKGENRLGGVRGYVLEEHEVWSEGGIYVLLWPFVILVGTFYTFPRWVARQVQFDKVWFRVVTPEPVRKALK